jgi:hypothetical protein
MENIKETKEFAQQWIEEGKPCVYRSGWGWKGAGARKITKEKALELLPQYSFGKGFYELSFIKIDGQTTLEFNELSENDMW